MTEQARQWSRAAEVYETEFIDPYRKDARNPIRRRLTELADSRRTVADLGCGIGPLLPFLSERFGKVFALDFAEGMLERAKERCRGAKNIDFIRCSFLENEKLPREVDVAVAVNSLVLPDPRELQQSVENIFALLKPGGALLGIVPAIDSVHYHTMLLLDRALERGMPPEQARKNAAQHGEHELYDFAFGEVRYRGLVQHFWQPFEVTYRLMKAGFKRPRLSKVVLSWEELPFGPELKEHPAPWDWFFHAEKPAS